MKLITHNLLMCNKAGCTTNNFPLKLIATKVELYNEESVMEYSKTLMQKLLEKIDYAALRATVESLQWQDVKPLPETANAEDEDFLMALHDICCKRHITEGTMCCPNCNREYGIRNGIANMLLNEDEV